MVIIIRQRTSFIRELWRYWTGLGDRKTMLFFWVMVITGRRVAPIFIMRNPV